MELKNKYYLYILKQKQYEKNYFICIACDGVSGVQK